MKKILIITLFSISFIGIGQNGINYKAVIKDASGAIIANDLIQVQFTILDGAVSVYQETHSPTTDANGIIIINIGEGAPVSGTFSTIDWGSMNHYLNVQIDTTGDFKDMGTTQFMAVPYALNVPKKQHVLGIPATAFSPNNNDCSFFNSLFDGGVEITSSNGATVVSVLNAQVQLPQGAQINSMTFYYIDNSDAQLSIQLQKEYYSPGFVIIAGVSSNGDSSTPVEETVMVNHTVNNENGGYFLRVYCNDWDESGSKKIKGAKIHYTY